MSVPWDKIGSTGTSLFQWYIHHFIGIVFYFRSPGSTLSLLPSQLTSRQLRYYCCKYNSWNWAAKTLHNLEQKHFNSGLWLSSLSSRETVKSWFAPGGDLPGLQNTNTQPMCCSFMWLLLLPLLQKYTLIPGSPAAYWCRLSSEKVVFLKEKYLPPAVKAAAEPIILGGLC